MCRYYASYKSNNLDDINRNENNDNVMARIHGKGASHRIRLAEQRECWFERGMDHLHFKVLFAGREQPYSSPIVLYRIVLD